MTEPTSPRAPLAVEADLDLTINGARADIRSTGDRLFVEFPSLRALGRARRGLPQTRMTEANALLAETDLTIEIRSRGRTVVAIGADAPAGRLSRWLGTAPAQVRLAGLAGALGQEFRAVVRVVRDLLG